MAKATNPRKPAREKRKGGAAAKRSARKSPTRARKVTSQVRAKAARPRPPRIKGRPSPHRERRLSQKRGRAAAQSSTGVASPGLVPAKAATAAPERVPPPLPVPIASFTF